MYNLLWVITGKTDLELNRSMQSLVSILQHFGMEPKLGHFLPHLIKAPLHRGNAGLACSPN